MHKYGFSFVQRHYYYKERILTAKEYILLLDTYSDVRIMEPDRKEAFFGKLKRRFWAAAAWCTFRILWICILVKFITKKAGNLKGFPAFFRGWRPA